MFNFFKYIDDLQLEVKFTPSPPSSSSKRGEVQIQVTDLKTGITETKFLTKNLLTLLPHSEAKIVNKVLDDIVVEIGRKKADIYGKKYDSHKRQELERFWRGE